ncbi:MAG: ATP-binding protein [Pirellulales bacterium]
MFAVLMAYQWLAAVVAALWISPRTWHGSASQTHLHVIMAELLGGVLASVPIVLAMRYPGQAFTRHTIAIAQVLFSTLLIHLTGGRIETHFHVFGSLAFLAFYGDWALLIAPTLIVAADHFLRGLYFPQSVYGVLVVSPWRWLEHAGWVLFEDLFLILSCRRNVAELRLVARRTAELSERTTELESALQSNRAIVDAALDAVVGFDGAGRIVDWNPQAEQLFGLTREEALGRWLTDEGIPPAFCELHAQGMAEYRRTGPTRVLNQRVEVVAHNAHRGPFPVEVAVVPIRHGDDVSFSVFIRDITERQRAEQSMLAAKEAAIAADKAKSAFLANMSHEIRTPLNGILGFTKLLLQSGPELPGNERDDYLQTVHGSATNLLALINDVLDLSKIEAGHLDVEIMDCNPGQIIAEVASLLRARAQEKGLRLEARCAGGTTTTIRTDPTRLRQLLLNLVGNAVKFTDQGQIEINAYFVPTADRIRYCIDVTDTGIGIAEDRIQHIFDPFVQGDNSVTRRYGGTGLGLAICCRLATALGGELRVRSVPGQGTTFSAEIDPGPVSPDIKLPLVPIEVFRPQASIASAQVGQLNGRVLVVEDGDTNRKLVSLVLRRAGVEVVEAENGQVGVEKASAERFDLILMDMQMPVLDGYNATRQLRQHGIDIPIIALTAHAMKGDEEECIAAGCSGYLAKPIDTDLLLRTVAGILTRAKRRPDVEQPLVSTLPLDDPEFQAIVASFRERLLEQLVAMRIAAAEQDLSRLRELAHWLKGAGGTVGFNILSVEAVKLMQCIDRQSSTEIGSILDELESTAARIAIPDAEPSRNPSLR